VLEKREFDQNDFLWRLSTAVAVVSGIFSVIVFLLIVFNYLQFRAADPVNNLMLTQMRQEYAALPEKDEALAERIRQLDLLNRKAFFTTQKHLQTGAIMLLVGVSVFLIAFKNSLRWKREKPVLEETPTAEKEFLAFAQARQLIMWGGVAMLAAGLGVTLMTESEVAEGSRVAATAPAGEAKEGDASAAPSEGADEGKGEAAAVAMAAIPAWDVIEKNWPSFRGPGASGMAYFKNAPTSWDVESGQGIRWKTEIALPGANSPVIWEKHIFLSGADETAREIYCFDADSGKLVWKQAVEQQGDVPPAAPKVTEDTGFAAPSMAAHGGRVFAIFANGDLVSYDAEGKKVWGINLGLPENHYGHASSLLAFEDRLYVQLDQSSEPKLLALDVSTGKEVWKAERQHISWASPILAHTPFGPQLILNSEATVDAYDPKTGALLWSQECLSGEVAPSPAYSNGIVFAANEYAIATAIRLEKTDEGIQPKILWEFDEYLPEVSSPVGDGERFYFGTSMGALVCLDAKTGEKLWAEEFEDGFYSSPVLVGDRIYILDNSGQMYIVKAAPEYNLIGKVSMGEPTFATPAFLDGRIYVRTEKHLYCIEQSNV
jgi:outer membrane protein assembly factor BamB